MQKKYIIKKIFFLFLLFLPFVLLAQLPDSVSVNKDSLQQAMPVLTPYQWLLKKLITDNKYLTTKGEPTYNITSLKRNSNHTLPFYFLLAVVGFLATIKFLYDRYFNTLFKVFFNTSLKQSQLTDQLLQAKFPSLLFNILFVVVGGVYIYVLLNYYSLNTQLNNWLLVALSILAVAVIYVAKYLALKFTGWLTGHLPITNTYTFIIFLINKIIGILLIPLIILIVFAKPLISHQIVVLSFMVIGFMFLFRFFRSYTVLQHQIKISRTHFFLYLLGAEIIPLLVCCKALALFLSKNT